MSQKINLNRSRMLARVSVSRHRFANRQRATQHYGFVKKIEDAERLTLNLPPADLPRELIACSKCGVNPSFLNVKGGVCGYCLEKSKSETTVSQAKTQANSFLNFSAKSRRNIIALMEQKSDSIAEEQPARGAAAIIPMSEIWQARLIFFALLIAVLGVIFITGFFNRF